MKNVRRKLFLSAGILGLLLSAQVPAMACDCMMPNPEGAFKQADAVFVGSVERFEPDDSWYEEHTGYAAPERKYVIKTNQLTAWVKVIRSWKGFKGDYVKVNTVPGPSCGYPFVVGQDYLIYATRASHGEFQASYCSGTKMLSQAQDDFTMLTTATTSGQLAIAAEDQTCQEDADCLVVQTTCGGCEGGAPINRLHQAKYQWRSNALCHNYSGENCERSSLDRATCHDHRCMMSATISSE